MTCIYQMTCTYCIKYFFQYHVNLHGTRCSHLGDSASRLSTWQRRVVDSSSTTLLQKTTEQYRALCAHPTYGELYSYLVIVLYFHLSQLLQKSTRVKRKNVSTFFFHFSRKKKNVLTMLHYLDQFSSLVDPIGLTSLFLDNFPTSLSPSTNLKGSKPKLTKRIRPNLTKRKKKVPKSSPLEAA